MSMSNLKFKDSLVVVIVLVIAIELFLNVDLVFSYQMKMDRSMYYYALVFFVYMYASTKFLTAYVKDISRAEKLFITIFIFISKFLIDALCDEIGW